ncbi:hypothetical protein [Arvimicrobium flavum]|uniref:hypothetical protein n=1 Tax=Arvimicrobium flavum TaxID=3393320 RepID=UPI00237A6CEB|nr:hypothetical protein [Mesorhizobium shangrilense]
MNFWLRLLIVVVAATAGGLLWPYLRSEWGLYAFIAGVGLVTSVGAAWRGRGKPMKVFFGAVVGAGFAFGLLVTAHTNAYVGLAVIVGLVFLGSRTGFFDRGLKT